jgi:hypothetical protein
MNKFRVLLVVSIAALMAACASTPSTAPKKAATPAAAAPVAPAAANLAGNWVVTIESQMGSQDSKLALKQTGKELSGTMESPMGSVDIHGDVDGNNVKMWFNVNAQGTDLKIDFIGTQENGTSMKGRAVFGSFGEGTFTAKKQ